MNIAIVGATGAVGRVMLDLLLERDFKFDSLKLLASSKSAGKEIKSYNRSFTVELLEESSFKNIDIALFSAGSSISRKYAKIAVKEGAVVIDNSSCFRMDKDVPLVIPEVNGEKISKKGIIANPNCTTIIMLTVLNRICKEIGVDKIVASTYQSVSGAGAKGIEELLNQEKQYIGGEEIVWENFSREILHNVIPQIGEFSDLGYTEEELKMSRETTKILDDENIVVEATSVRVPVLTSHSESITFNCRREASFDEIENLLSNSEGVKYFKRSSNGYPTPLETSGKDCCYAGRLRKSKVFDNGFTIWITGDQLRKGAALNAVQIAEKLRA
ncbi:MAG: aspartate-semialdehyde dehydrogenase [Candidatus Cloacimonadota bacterium]|nr:MAG: aspartate-semialdehyde dehydrogenase [Candidatus Cloacimonadota bacterium]PIE79261.1 MAG: aspartate-semialdehyde dehydrogenase [Candidatus Delongbacteria bacterium]